jgi:hypothetical protein
VAITSPFFCLADFLCCRLQPAGHLLLPCLTPHLDGEPEGLSTGFTRRHGNPYTRSLQIAGLKHSGCIQTHSPSHSNEGMVLEYNLYYVRCFVSGGRACRKFCVGMPRLVSRV